MKNNIRYIIPLLVSAAFCYGQQGNVGINTANPQGVLHIDGAKDNPATGTPSAAQQANDFTVQAAGSQVNVGVGTLSPKVKLDARAADGSNSAIGFGTSTLTPAQANEGAIRYNPSNSGSQAKVEYSNSGSWVPLWNAPYPPKVVVIAYKDDSKVQFSTNDAPFNPSASPVNNQSKLYNNGVNYMVSWTKKFEGVRNADGSTTATNNFNAATGVFTAPRDGNYIATFTYDLAPINISGLVGAVLNPLQIEAVWRLFDNSNNWVLANNLVNTVKCANSFTQATSIGTTLDAGINCTGTFHMTAGQRLVPYTWFNLNQGVTNPGNDLKTTAGGYSGYNNLTIVEQ